MKNLTWQNPEQLFVAQELINKVKSKCCGIKDIVISVGAFGHCGDNEVWAEGTKAMLDCMHLAKIDLADEIFVINVDNYIGDSTRNEIEYAKSKGKKVRFLE